MITVYQIFLILHIVMVSVWFGNGLATPGRIRRGLAAGDAEAKFMEGEVDRGLRISLIFGIASIVTGFLLIFNRGGFAHVSKFIHMGLGLSILNLLVQVLIIGGTWKKIAAIIGQGGDRSAANSLRGRIAMGSGISQLLWVAILVLMVMQRGNA